MRRYPLTMVVIAAVCLVSAGCTAAGGSGAVSAPTAPGWSLQTPQTTTGRAPFDLAAALDEIRTHSMTPNVPQQPLAGPLRAISAVCTGSADGACMAVYFFDESRLVGTVGNAAAVLIDSQDGQQVVLRYPQFRHGDALCCPSGGDVRHTARLVNGQLQLTPPVSDDPNNTGAM